MKANLPPRPPELEQADRDSTPGFASPEEAAAYDAWLTKKIDEALADPCPSIPHEQAMAEIRQFIADSRAKSERKTKS